MNSRISVARGYLAPPLMAMFSLALAAGCGSSVPPPFDNNVPASAVQESGGEPPAEAHEQPGPPADEQGSPGSVQQDAAPPTASAGSNDGSSAIAAGDSRANEALGAGLDEFAAPQADRAERFLLLAVETPLVVEATITVDGKSHERALQELVDEVLELADTDGDGAVRWDEITESPRLEFGQFGNPPSGGSAERRQLIRLYDVNRNGRVDRGEVPRYLNRNRGGSTALQLTSSNLFRGDNRSRSYARQLLDVDEDGTVSEAEMNQASVRLLSRDADEDELLYLADFRPSSNLAPGQRPMRRRYGPDSAMRLRHAVKWDLLLYSLQELYAYGGKLETGSFSLLPKLAEQLDGNHDGEIDKYEIVKLDDVAPQLAIAVDFGAPGGKEVRLSSRLRLVSLDKELREAGATVSETDQQVTLRFGEVTVQFAVNDLAENDGYDARAQAQLENLDRDKNGYLDAEELPEALADAMPLAAIDMNADHKIEGDELAAFYRQQQSAQRVQVRVRASDQEDALFSALDQDGDGRLVSREIADSPERLRELDTNGNQELEVAEIPGSMEVVFARGDPSLGDALFQRRVVAYAPSDSSIPRWFQRMDSNGDRELSPREFLGSQGRFRQLDADGDGYIEPNEIPPAEE